MSLKNELNLSNSSDKTPDNSSKKELAKNVVDSHPSDKTLQMRTYSSSP